MIQLKVPLPKFALMGFFSALLKPRCLFRPRSLDKRLGNFVPFVHPLSPGQALTVTILRKEGLVDGLGVFKHELLRCGTTAGFGVGLLVGTFEERKPRVGLATTGGVAGRRSVAEPRGDSLEIVSHSSGVREKPSNELTFCSFSST